MFSFSAEHLSEGLWQPPGTWVLTPLYAPTIRPRLTVSGFRQKCSKEHRRFLPPALSIVCGRPSRHMSTRTFQPQQSQVFMRAEMKRSGAEASQEVIPLRGRAWLIMVLRFGGHVALRGSVTWEKCTAKAVWLYGRSSCSVWHVLKWAAPFPPHPALTHSRGLLDPTDPSTGSCLRWILT